MLESLQEFGQLHQGGYLVIRGWQVWVQRFTNPVDPYSSHAYRARTFHVFQLAVSYVEAFPGCCSDAPKHFQEQFWLWFVAAGFLRGQHLFEINAE